MKQVNILYYFFKLLIFSGVLSFMALVYANLENQVIKPLKRLIIKEMEAGAVELFLEKKRQLMESDSAQSIVNNLDNVSSICAHNDCKNLYFYKDSSHTLFLKPVEYYTVDCRNRNVTNEKIHCSRVDCVQITPIMDLLDNRIRNCGVLELELLNEDSEDNYLMEHGKYYRPSKPDSAVAEVGNKEHNMDVDTEDSEQTKEKSIVIFCHREDGASSEDSTTTRACITRGAIGKEVIARVRQSRATTISKTGAFFSFD